MSCPGLHCPGCSGGQSLGVLAAAVTGLVAARQMFAWVAGRFWWIGGLLAASAAVAVAVSMALETRSERRGAAYAAAHGILSRADAVAAGLPACGVRRPLPAVSGAPRRGLPAPAIHLHLHGDDGMEAAARIIRTALPGQAGIQPEGNRNGIASHDT